MTPEECHGYKEVKKVRELREVRSGGEGVSALACMVDPCVVSLGAFTDVSLRFS